MKMPKALGIFMAFSFIKRESVQALSPGPRLFGHGLEESRCTGQILERVRVQKLAAPEKSAVGGGEGGFLAEMKYEFGYGLSSRLGYTYTLAKVAEDQANEPLKGKYLTTYYRHKYLAGLTYHNPSLISGSVSFRYNAHRYADPQNTEVDPDSMNLDLSLWRKINRVMLRLNIENLTNETSYVEDGILYYGSVRFDF